MRPTGTRWHTPPPPADPPTFVTEAIAIGGWAYLIELRLFVDAETAADILDPTLGTVHVDDLGCRLRIGTDDLHWAAGRVAALGIDFEVLGPEAFSRALGDLGAWLQSIADS